LPLESADIWWKVNDVLSFMTTISSFPGTGILAGTSRLLLMTISTSIVTISTTLMLVAFPESEPAVVELCCEARRLRRSLHN
jgi:hypothetical protein